MIDADRAYCWRVWIGARLHSTRLPLLIDNSIAYDLLQVTCSQSDVHGEWVGQAHHRSGR